MVSSSLTLQKWLKQLQITPEAQKLLTSLGVEEPSDLLEVRWPINIQNLTFMQVLFFMPMHLQLDKEDIMQLGQSLKKVRLTAPQKSVFLQHGSLI